MARIARIVVPGVPHHITQRGNNHQDVFFVEDDRREYLRLLAMNAARYGLQVLGYCLMTNHMHLVGVPKASESLAKAVGRTHFAYTQYIARLHGRSGHLWQNRFYSCPMDDEALWPVLVYVDRNPVRAGLVAKAWDWPWSSAAVHAGKVSADPAVDLAAWKRLAEGVQVRSLLVRDEDAATVQRLRRSTHTGRPLAGDAFLATLEKLLGRRMRPLPVGRPRQPDPAIMGKPEEENNR
jgi:putative transposase